MKNSITITTALVLVFFATSCKNGDSTTAVSRPTVVTAIQLPNTPEEVVKTWESQVAQNQFAEAGERKFTAGLDFASRQRGQLVEQFFHLGALHLVLLGEMIEHL